jgi:hypothetical protein
VPEDEPAAPAPRKPRTRAHPVAVYVAFAVVFLMVAAALVAFMLGVGGQAPYSKPSPTTTSR